MIRFLAILAIVCLINLVLIAIRSLGKAKKKYITYNHHGNLVTVREDLRGKHRDYCLCWSCKELLPEDRVGNCPIANAIYKNCVEFEVVTPVWECPNFNEK